MLKKMTALTLAFLLVLSLAGCGATGQNAPTTPSESTPPAGSLSIPEQEAPEDPDAPDEGAETETMPAAQTPEESQEPEKPEEGAQMADLTFHGMADAHSVEVSMEDGELRVFQFDQERFWDVLSRLDEGDVFRIAYRVEHEGDTESCRIVEYYGPVYAGIDLLDASWEAVSVPEGTACVELGAQANVQMLLAAREELKQFQLWSVAYEEETGTMKRGECLYAKEAVEPQEMLAVSAYLHELIPNLLIQFTTAEGEQVRYLAACNLIGVGLPVIFLDAAEWMEEE